jgi:hypothetical protein
MEIIKKRTFQIVLALIISGAVTASPALAGMGGGSGGGSGSGMNGSNEDEQNARQGRDMNTKGMSTNREFGDMGSMSAITTGGLGSGDMTMEVTPVKYNDGRLEVKYYANTHSVSLGKYDLMELCTLEVDGKVYQPVKADRMRGHHAGGRIVFEVPEMPDRFRIVIRDIPTVEERSYDWN